MKQIRLNIDRREILAMPGQNLLQVALDNDIEIPHLCHDERVEAYGGCGMCVVEVEGNPKLVRACSTPVVEGMVVTTDTPRTHGARKTALELLLSDHIGDCRPPCVLACPAETDCQGYVGLIANGQYQEAVALIKEKLPLPSCIGRVCPHPCETACRRALVEDPVAIADLKWFVGDIDLEGDSFVADIKPSTGKRVAVVGSGPAGLTAAYFLTREGHSVTIYEAMPETGGMLRYGIPQYRLPKDIVDKEVGLIEAMGVEIKTHHRLGTDISLGYLNKSYDAVFLGLGAWKSSSMRCEGEDKVGVYGGIDFLRQVTMNDSLALGQKVIIVGGGNTAMDAARTAVRLGAEDVRVLYRRTRAEMPAEDLEIVEAEEEGVRFHFLVAPSEVLGEERATGLRCQKMRLGEPDASGRRRPEPIPGDEEIFEADSIIAAIGQQVTAGDIAGLELTKYGTIDVDKDSFETNIPGVFAGGDVVTGPGIAIEAVDQGRKAALAMDGYLKGKFVPFREDIRVEEEKTAEDFVHHKREPRVPMRVTPPETRRHNFKPIVDNMTEKEAREEASRCLECGCGDYFECQLFKYMNEYEAQPKRLKGEEHHRYEEQEHPFIVQNPDKCVLCGLCVRVCDEVMGIGALGLVDRGFDTIVRPEFGIPLEDSECISCGQCVALCPVGALMEIPGAPKAVPVETDRTTSTCSFCSVGCEVIIETRGDLVFRALPSESDGLLCARGRFGLYQSNDEVRVLKPLVESVETPWDDALMYTAKGLQAAIATGGPRSVAIVASPRLTNEESFMIRKLSEHMGTDIFGSFTLDGGSGLEEVLGYNASTNSFDEIPEADVLLCVGNVAENHPILGTHIRAAGKGQTDIISISAGKTRLDQEAREFHHIGDDLEFFKGMVKVLLEHAPAHGREARVAADDLEKLKSAVAHVEVTDEMASAAKAYGKARKAIIVVDEESVSTEVIKLLADMAVITDKVGRAHNGIITLKPKNNSQGAWDMGLRTTRSELTELIESGQIKALLILGEDPLRAQPGLSSAFGGLEFLAVMDELPTETARMAKVVLPLASPAETEGTFTRTDRRVQRVTRALRPRTGRSNPDIIAALGKHFGVRYSDKSHIWREICQEVPEYRHIPMDRAGENLYWPKGAHPLGEQLLYHEGFATGDGRARLFIPSEGKAFKERIIFDTLEQNFVDFAKRHHIKI